MTVALTEEERLRRNLKQQSWRKRRILAGAPLRVDAEPYADILRKWRAAGFSSEVLALYTDTNGSFVRKLIAGEKHQIARRFAVKLDAVTARALIAVAKDEMRVPAIGTVRRIRAAAWLGHPTTEFMPFRRFWPYSTGETISLSAGAHREVAARYRVLSQVIGPSKEARVHAQTKRWPGPALWDDTNIDDPYAGPLKLYRHRKVKIDKPDTPV